MFNRHILFVDDDAETREVNFPLYHEAFDAIKINNLFEGKKLDYDIHLEWARSIDKGLEILKEKQVYDVIVIDYDFSRSEVDKKGIELVQLIRKDVNKKCKIVFYTMNHPNAINAFDFVYLINNDVFRFVSKDGDALSTKYDYGKNVFNKSDQLVVEAIVDAIIDTDPISNILERYFYEYSNILKDVKLNIADQLYSIEEVVETIRLDQAPGNIFVKNLLEISITNFLNKSR